jgi:hypothetical protein
VVVAEIISFDLECLADPAVAEQAHNLATTVVLEQQILAVVAVALVVMQTMAEQVDRVLLLFHTQEHSEGQVEHTHLAAEIVITHLLAVEHTLHKY